MVKSPFPGMDPYLERHWRDVHHSLCTYAKDVLQPQVTPALRARVEERLVVEAEGAEPRSIYPDAKIFEREPRGDVYPRAGWSGDSSAVAVAEPLIVRVETEPFYEGFIAVIDPTTGGKLVTVIEFLSTTNKVGTHGPSMYQQKQRELLGAGVSLVEIDLLRAGGWVLRVPMEHIAPRHRTPYRACVQRAWAPIEYEFYPMPLAEPLPTIRIPLRKTDNDALLDIQSLIAQVYANGAYDDLDYRSPPEPALGADAEAWADKLLKSASRR